MQLACKSCGKAIPAEDVNIDKAIAKCQACHAVFSFLDRVGSVSTPLVRPQVAMPKGFVVDNWGPELSITRRWYSHGLWFLLFFCIFWDGFLVVWYSIAIGGLLSGQGGGGMWIMVVFPVLHVLVGLGLTYAVLCGFLNKTSIRVSLGELSIKHGPLPTGGNRQILTIDLQQLYCTENKRHSKHGVRFNYDLQALLASGTKVKLLSNLDELDQALFVEQQIEQHLRIADERVAGEVAV
jgi:hypothetical protein